MKRPGTVWIIILIFVLMTGACSLKNGSQQTLRNEDYRKLAEAKGEKAPLMDDRAMGKIPEMSAEEYDRMGDRHLEEGKTELAFLYYYKSLVLKPDENKVRYKLGRIYLEKGFPGEAAKEFRQIISRDPNFALAYDGLGRANVASGDFKNAEENFRKAISLNGSLWEDKNFLGFVLDQQKRYDEAIPLYQQAIAVKPEQGYLYNNLGISYLLKGEYEKAVKSFLEAIKTGEQSSKVYNNLGVALFRSGRQKEAFEAFKKGSGEAAAYNNMGYVYLSNGKYEEAVQNFDAAINLNPKYYEKAHENKNRTISAMGNMH